MALRPHFATFFWLAMSAHVEAAAPTCPAAVPDEQMALSYEAFDAGGWRELLAQGCTDAAVASLERYQAANQSRLSAEQTRELRFHVGQTLAMSGRDAESVAHFERSAGGDEEWDAYVQATIAFLKREAEALVAQRARYAQAAGASAMRLAVIDGFVACPGQSYVAAVRCGMARMRH
jgi:hypothetical protein